jgi:hypothetical protein
VSEAAHFANVQLTGVMVKPLQLEHDGPPH